MKITINESQLNLIILNNLLSEEVIGFLSLSRDVAHIYKNPVTVKKFSHNARGFLMSDGDLFVVDDGYNIIHTILGDYLRRKGYNIPSRPYNHPEIVVPIQRKGLTNDFYLGEGYRREELNDPVIMEKILSILDVGRQRHPQFSFIPKSINDAYLIDK